MIAPRRFFPLPPFSEVNAPNFRDSLCARQMEQFNAALCEYYSRHCLTHRPCPPPSREESSSPTDCYDEVENCLVWSHTGECEKNPTYMRAACKQSCGACTGVLVHLGAPGNCRDASPAEECEVEKAAGACEARRAEMQESCRMTCGMCADDSALAAGVTPARLRSFDHSCPDGSDLGHGENSSPSIPGAPPPPPAPVSPTPVPKKPSAAALESGPAGGEGPSRSALATRAPPSRSRLHFLRQDHDVQVMPEGTAHIAEALTLAWPLLVVGAMLCAAVGYVLRGCVEARRKRRAGAAARGARRGHSATYDSTVARHL